MSAEDVDVRNLNKTFYQLLAMREKAVQEMLGEGYSLANAEDRAEIDSLIATHDDTLARLSYQLYVSTGGALNKFSLLRNSAIATEWEQRAKSAVRQLETAKAAASVPTVMYEVRTVKESAPQKKPEQKSTAGRWLDAVRGWLSRLAGKPKPETSRQQPSKAQPKAQQQSQQPSKAQPKAQQQSQQPSKAQPKAQQQSQQPAKGTATQKPQPVEIVITDVVIEKVASKKQAENKKKTQEQKPKITVKSFGEVK
jgi:hypothetical protein